MRSGYMKHSVAEEMKEEDRTMENMEEKKEFTHFDAQGNAYMVDVSGKEITSRMAIATGEIKVTEEVFAAILGKKIKKGDVLTVAQVAGIMGAKRTSELIPMCHILNLTNAKVWFELHPETTSITAFCQVKTEGKTGVEMEALTGVNVGAVLPWLGAVILVLISMTLTLVAGLIPSGVAARKDPVEALRTD